MGPTPSNSGSLVPIVVSDGNHKTERVRGLDVPQTQSGREDSNLRPLDPQSSALTRLRYAPSRPCAEAP